jgi:urease accessory protein UreE
MTRTDRVFRVGVFILHGVPQPLIHLQTQDVRHKRLHHLHTQGTLVRSNLERPHVLMGVVSCLHYEACRFIRVSVQSERLLVQCKSAARPPVMPGPR